MDNISDVANVGGGGALVGWLFFFVIVGGAYFYNQTNSMQRYQIKKWITAIFGYMAVIAGVIWLFQIF